MGAGAALSFEGSRGSKVGWGGGENRSVSGVRKWYLRRLGNR